MEVRVCIPVQDSLDKGTARWLLWLSRLVDPQHNYDISLVDAAGYGVAIARNNIVRDFLQSSGEVLWMIDSDTVPPYSTRIMEGIDTYPALVGPYPGVTAKGIRWHLYKKISQESWAPMHPKFVPKTRYFRVDAAGLGCCLLRRELLESLPVDPFEFKRASDGEWTGEDMLFGQLLGGIMCDTEYVCEHNRRASLVHVWRMSKMDG